MTKRQKVFLKCLEETKGIVTTAARSAGLDPSTHYKWLSNDPEYREAVEKVQNSAGETKCVFLLNPDFTKPQSSGET